MINVIAQFQTTLTSGISAAATTGVLESNASADNDGATIPDGDYGIVIDERNGRREYAIITVSGYDFTFVKRGLSMIDGDTEKAGNTFAHRKGAEIKIVSHPVITQMVRIFNGDDPLTGILYNDAARTYTSDYQLVDKKYVDDVAIAGAAKASESVYGIAKLSVAAASSVAPIVVGDNDPRVPTEDENDALAGTGTPSSSDKFVNESYRVFSPVGMVSPYAGATAPTGWLLSDGSAVSRTTYAALFAVVGETYGAGDGTTTFNLPDLSGNVPVGKSADTEFDTLGETGGEKTHILLHEESGVPAHDHQQTVHNDHLASQRVGDGAGGYSTAEYSTNDGNTPLMTAENTPADAAQAHNNLQPYITLNYIIKF